MKDDAIKVGDIYGDWTVLEKTDNLTSEKFHYWLCRCSCGIEKLVDGRSLLRGKSTSCGHGRMKKMKEARIEKCEAVRKSYIGQRFGRLTVIGLSDKTDEFHHKFVKAKCDCGTEIETTIAKLKSGHTSSCGCIKSKGEEEIANILTNLQISFAKEVRFTDCRDKKPLPFDFGIYYKNKLKGLIEYNGDIHYKESLRGHFAEDPNGFLKRQKHDRIKAEYCKKNNIPLLVIPYTVTDIENFLITSQFWKQIFNN